MNFSDLLKKENVYKAAALLLVLVFIFSSFTIGILGNPQGEKQNATPGEAEGEVVVNATLLSYQPYIIADTNNETIANELRNISGVEEIMLTSQGYVISLGSGANITEAYSYMKKMNVSGKANAVLSIAGVEIPAGNGTVRVSGGEINARLEPVFEEGENLTIRVYLRAQSGRITAYGAVSVLPRESVFQRNGSVVALAETKTIISVPWEKRYAVLGDVENLGAKYGQGNVSYARKDFVIANISNESKPSYVVLVAGDTAYVNNITDRALVEADLKNAGFPDSIITVNANAPELENFSRIYRYVYNVKIMEGGAPVFVALESSRSYAENETVELEISAYALKDRIISIAGAREAG